MVKPLKSSCKMHRYTTNELEMEAKRLGATYSRICFIDRPTYWDKNHVEAFSVHFFNDDNLEIGYYIDSEQLYQLCGLTLFEKPRVWGLPALMHKLTGKPVDLDTICVRKLVNPILYAEQHIAGHQTKSYIC